MASTDIEKLIVRLEAVTDRLENVSAGKSASQDNTSSVDDPDWLDDYNKLHDGIFKKFIQDSKSIGGDVEKQALLVEKAFAALRDFMIIAARNNRPTQNDLQSLLKPLAEGISGVQDFREKNRKSVHFNFLSAVSEGIPALGWIAVAPKPAAYIVQMEESSMFYTNKVLKEFRSENPTLADWSTTWIKLIKAMQEYVKDQHKTGIQWNKNAPAATSTTKAAETAASPPPPAGGPPPPPPPPGPPPPPVATGAPAKGGDDSKAALFASLNKGEGVTSGLKKVSADMQTHKNPELRNQAPVPAKSSNLAPRPYGASPQLKKFGGGAAAPVKKPPVFELQNKKWVVEWQENNQGLMIDTAEPSHTVYVYKCNNSNIQVKNKVNSIILDQCKKCALVFESTISSVEFVNCQSVKVQANGSVPTISVDKTDGCAIYLNKTNLGCQIVSAKSSELNVCITSDDGDLTETPLPEQFMSTWNGGKWVTEVMALNL